VCHDVLKRVARESLCDGANKSFNVTWRECLQSKCSSSKMKVGQKLLDSRIVGTDRRLRESPDINQILSIGGKNCGEWHGCCGSRSWYVPLAAQEALQAPHCVRSATRTVTKESVALSQLLDCQRIKAADPTTAEIHFDCRTSENVALTSVKTISAPAQPVIEVIQDTTQ
jgi:hypothetical protein